MPTDVRALIDRIADALGDQATPERVERVARAVLDARAPSPPARASHAPLSRSDGPPASRLAVTGARHATPANTDA